jgi:phosphatidate cytidylyltransferase
MLTKRLLVALVIIPVGVGFIYVGGWAYNFLIAAMLATAAWEFQAMFRQGGYQPASWVLMIGVILLALGRGLWGMAFQDLLLAGFAMTALAVHTVRFERGAGQAGVNFSITLAGLIYLGWLGSYLISLRDLPNGLWWTLIALPAVSSADAGAYFIGSRFGRRHIAPRTSPKKSWEGYLGGIVTGSLAGWGFAALWSVAEPAILPWQGLVIGLAVTTLAIWGDLGESLFKRQFQIKDSGSILPGHGGMMDRMDTWLYASVIAYYLIQLF